MKARNPLKSTVLIPTIPLHFLQPAALLYSSSSLLSAEGSVLSPLFSADSNAEMGIIKELPPTLNGLGVGAVVTVGAALTVGEGVGDSVGE